jgi:hypothetical protein
MPGRSGKPSGRQKKAEAQLCEMYSPNWASTALLTKCPRHGALRIHPCVSGAVNGSARRRSVLHRPGGGVLPLARHCYIATVSYYRSWRPESASLAGTACLYWKTEVDFPAEGGAAQVSRWSTKMPMRIRCSRRWSGTLKWIRLRCGSFLACHSQR